MVQGASQGPPTADELEAWTSDHGITHPMLLDVDATQIPYVLLGFPTYVVIDGDMVIQNADMWPWDDAYILGLVEAP